MENKSFLGRGWQFPPTFIKTSAGVQLVEEEVDIVNSLEVLLTTIPGERFLTPDYGCDLSNLLFEPIDFTLTAYIRNLIKTAILYHEPRIRPEKIDLFLEAENGRIMLAIEYTVISTNTRTNKVFPFYLDEGTNIPR
ncbi:MAG: GPW/gp25 family protein [Spirosomataceae bacterium]